AVLKTKTQQNTRVPDRHIACIPAFMILDEDFADLAVGKAPNAAGIFQAGHLDLERLGQAAIGQALSAGHGATLGPPWKAPPWPESPGSEGGFSNKPSQGCLPARNGHSGQETASQRRASAKLPPEQSRHLARIALSGLWRWWPASWAASAVGGHMAASSV